MNRPEAAQRRLASFGLAVALVVSACSGSPMSTVSPPRAPTLPPAASPLPTSPVVGVIVDIVSAGLDKVTAFTIRTDSGQRLDFAIGVLENGAQFPPGHLSEHRATLEPVRVYFRVVGPSLVAYRIEDASAGASPAPS